VTTRLEGYVRRHFSPADADVALRRLNDLALPLAERQSLERIQSAIVFLANGDLGRLERSASLAEKDWRDVLVWSGLADADWEGRLDDSLGPRDPQHDR
jgi:hypothetical protein